MQSNGEPVQLRVEPRDGAPAFIVRAEDGQKSIVHRPTDAGMQPDVTVESPPLKAPLTYSIGYRRE